MDMSCPYCQGTTGYQVMQQVRRQANSTWDGTFTEYTGENVFYQGKCLRCSDCGEKVTSFVKGAHREVDNA